MALRPAKLRTSIRLTVVTVFLLATTLTALLAISLQYYFGQQMARKTAAGQYAAASAAITAKLDNIADNNLNTMALLVANPVLGNAGSREAQLELFTSLLERNPLYYGIYLGRADNSFLEVINLNTSEYARKALGALPSDRWVVTTVNQGIDGLRRTLDYLDQNLKLRSTRTEPTDFTVTERHWYQAAVDSQGLHRSEPYLFAQLGIPGQTLSRRIAGSNTVVGIDFTISTISSFLRENSLAEHSEIYLYNGAGQVIASSAESPVALPLSADPGSETAQAWSRPEGDTATRAGSDLPDTRMLDIASNPAQQARIVESRQQGENWLLYVAPTSNTAGSGDPLYIGIRAPLSLIVAPFLEEVRLSIAITGVFLLLLAPLSWFFANPVVQPIRQLARENDKVRKREYDKVERVSSRVLELDELSESMVQMVDAIRAHEIAQRRLMDSFIELIAAAIDDKSAYTGGHCERVPELALMLARRASASTLPAFSEFQLNSDDQWREYRIAAWLHDCGKITTPEHIVDKGSKLETIYNRIHEIRTRFEVLWRDAEIDYWKAIATRAGEPEALQTQLDDRHRQLKENFEFVARCNVGGEYLAAEDQQRLREIAATRWQRHFDNRIGLSPAEELRLSANPGTLPAVEHLLADRPEHLIGRAAQTEYPARFGINMEVPRYLANLGELYNLSVSRGTLTEEDRFRINEHMISTIKMLESLPFPEELRNVPRYASTHHETMRGSGYPRKLKGEELSIPERILAVADIFEALTASDRPYKKAKTISEAIEILHRMVIDQHVDRDCFELFIREGVYLDYAREFLEPEQIDEVDVARYTHPTAV